MAEMMGGAILEIVFQKLLEQLASPELRENSVASKLKVLKKKLKKVRLYVDDAENKQLFDEHVKEWLEDLKHVVLMADDLVEQINNSKKEKAVARAIKSVYHSLAKTVQGEIDLILTDLDDLYDLAHDLKLEHISSSMDASRISAPAIVAPLRESPHVYGRDAEKDKILEMLELSGGDSMIVIPILGMGGLGKTTLAHLVYNDKRVEENGFPKAWVSVSEFDETRIRNELQQHMEEAVKAQRFLCVLDDAWEPNYNGWCSIKKIFQSIPRSRVIVTTRMNAVALKVATGGIHKLEEIKDEEACWSMFVHHAFSGDESACPELHDTGKKIVKTCKGLPLAIRCLGGLLRSERSLQKWKNILLRDLGDWSKVMENEAFPSLWLSYRCLSSSLKQCFAYCSVFPQGYRFSKKQMVLWWMAEGFVRSKKEGKRIEDVGEEYFDDLVARSLFQRSSQDGDMYFVQDLLHDLAAFVYGKFCFSTGHDFKNVTLRTRHLTYEKHGSSDKLPTNLSTSKHLRTYMNIQVDPERVSEDASVKDILVKAKCLRVLTISLSSAALCHSIGYLKMLRYLNLSRSQIEELPRSICSLFHLQTLILSWCQKLTQLPTDLPRKLLKLRHLDISDTSLTEMPPKMGSIEELQILTEFVLGGGNVRGCSTLKELGELRHLGGKLRISKLQNMKNLEDAKMAKLSNKEKMKELLLSWDEDTSNMIQAVQLLNALQPHNNLEKLEVHNYPGSSFPKWVGETSFSNMVSVILNGGRSSVLPPLGQLLYLRELNIYRFEEVEKIGNEFFYGIDSDSSRTPFPSLESLSFDDMRSWKEWSFVVNDIACFPRLENLRLGGCLKLECINREDDRAEMESTKLHHRCPSLRRITISNCPILERRYQKYEGDHWHYISHIPEIHIQGPTTCQLDREGEKRRDPKEKSESLIPRRTTTDELDREEEERRQGQENSESHISTTDDLETESRPVLTALFEKLFELYESLYSRMNPAFFLKVRMLVEKLKKVTVYLDAAEDRQLRDVDVKEWLDQLNHVIFMADDLVEKMDNYTKTGKMVTRMLVSSKRASLVRIITSVLVRNEIDLILSDLDSLFFQASLLGLTRISSSANLNTRSSPIIMAPLQQERRVYGREAEKKEILKMLLSEKEMIVIPIVGMGGVGKTTLANSVYCDDRVNKSVFELKAWINVDVESDIRRIIKELLQNVNHGTTATGISEINDPNELQRLMQEAVNGKRFLFVLDDLWNMSYSSWDTLKSIFLAGDPRSRVIITTRSEHVGSMVKTGPVFEMKEASNEDSWSIFVAHAFNGDIDAADPELLQIGERIVKKCKGLPLAVRILGGLLRSERNPRKWENILHLGDWSELMEFGVLPSLWLSYCSLSPSLKQCFAYCSLFPQDYEFDKKVMVLWWMAEGFIRSTKGGKSMEEVGEEYFDDLVSRSLFQRLGEDDKYVVHDLVHDLATFVYGTFCFRIGDDDLKKATVRTRHLTCYKYVSSDDLLTSLSTSEHLRTLMYVKPDEYFHVSPDFVKEIALNLRCLRVLTISLPRSALCRSLGHLKMLRYLNLSGSEIEELPDSICSLFHLQTLILFKCRFITQLPTHLPRKLSNLRYLNTIETSIRAMPPKMGSLIELRILTDFVLGKGDGSVCSTLQELGELHHLGGLHISNLENVENAGDVKKANLKDKAQMKVLLLSWGDIVQQAEDVLGALQPHKNLEKIEVHNYPGSSFPNWVGETSFSRMAFVKLKGGTTRFLPPLGLLPSLRELHVEGFEAVEEIGNEFLHGNDPKNSSITPFPSLEQLEFIDMRWWKEWSFDGNDSLRFPRLKQLLLERCPELESIIKDVPPSLCQLTIRDCPLLESKYQRYKGDHWRHISHIHKIYIQGQKTDELDREEEERRQGEEKSESQIPEIHETDSAADELELGEEEMRQEEQISESHIPETHE